MELKRGKTFIKSSLHAASHEKTPGPAAPTPARDQAGPFPPGGQRQATTQRVPQVSPSTNGHHRGSNRATQPDPEGGTAFKLVWKSKSQDSVPGAGRAATPAGQLVGSASFPGPSSVPRMIDYRHLVPQVPFVPAVAKSIPRKRISLKRPKKCFRNLFHLSRNKTENLASLAAGEKSLPSPGSPSEARGMRGQACFALGEGLGLDGLCQDLSDGEALPDAPHDLCRALCEDVASLKSFDSLTGCGEIFADESALPPLELDGSLPGSARASQALENQASRGPGRGGPEQPPSPTQSEVFDLAAFWARVNHSVRQQRRALLGPRPEGPAGAGNGAAQPGLDAARLAELPLWTCRDLLGGSKASSTDTGTPKSEQPESVSTSDEGYYDAFSPSLEEDRPGAPNPGAPAASFPRESYSGDALYDLFYDPSEGPEGAGLDDGDLCVSESLSGPAPGAPLSMCSFRVGADERLAAGPGPDLPGQGFPQSSWRGKDCLLKLCDTELAVSMGVVNWLRRGPVPRALPSAAPGEPASPPPGLAEKPRADLEEKGPSPGVPEGCGAGVPDTGEIAVGSKPHRQDLWVGAGAKGPVAAESQGSVGAERGASPGPGDPSVTPVQVSGKPGTCGGHDSPSCPAGPTASEVDAPSEQKVITPLAGPQSPEHPGGVGSPQDWREPGLTGSPPSAEPTLADFVAQMEVLEIDWEPLAMRPPRPRQARDVQAPQQKWWPGSPGMAATHGPLTSPPCVPQAPQRPGFVLDLCQPRVQATQARAPLQSSPCGSA